jgi:hypothetical protein
VSVWKHQRICVDDGAEAMTTCAHAATTYAGKKLVWDLNRNGKIDASERTITERELYDATLGAE